MFPHIRSPAKCSDLKVHGERIPLILWIGGRGLEGLISIRLRLVGRSGGALNHGCLRCQFAPISLPLPSLLSRGRWSLVGLFCGLPSLPRTDFLSGCAFNNGFEILRRRSDDRSQEIISRKGLRGAKSAVVRRRIEEV